MSNEAIVINDNYVTPDNYKFVMREVRVKRWWFFTKVDHLEATLKLHDHKKNVCIDDKKWERIRVLAKRNYPIILYENNAGEFEPVRLVRQEGPFSKELMNSDKRRDFKKFVNDTTIIAKNRLTRLIQAAVLVLMSILGVAVFIIGLVLLAKFAVDHTQLLGGVASNSSQMGGFLNYTTSKLGG